MFEGLVRLNEHQWQSKDARLHINTAQWYDEKLGGTRHGYTVELDGRDLGKKIAWDDVVASVREADPSFPAFHKTRS
jgi:hypothetical protein